jgi:type II secretory pathway predicted ATPase ExeA
MYKEFYGLEDSPFTLTPDPRFIVFTPSYNEVLASLYYGLENAKGLIVLTGEVGTGKTTALRWILRRLDSSVLAAYVFNPRLSVDEFYHHVTQMLGINDWSNKAELLSIMGKVLEERHRRGLRTVLIIDEAHELSDYVLEEIRLLMNFESDNAKHLQIVLTGQPELREKLNQPNLRQLKQRVALRCKIHALPNVDETERYITERLLIAGSDEPNVFTPGAIDYIFQCSEGIPRQINNLCDNAMLAGYAAGDQIISRSIIEEVADNLDLLPRKDALNAAVEQKNETVVAPRVLKQEAREELWSNQTRRVEETVKPKIFQQQQPEQKKVVNGNFNGAAAATSAAMNGNGSRNGNGNGNGNGSGKYKPFNDLDDDINLEI